MHILKTLDPVKTSPEFRKAWIAFLTSRIGDGFYSVALVWLSYSLTNSAEGVGIVLSSYALSTFIFGLFAGVAADRYSKRMLMIASNVICGLLVIAIPLAAKIGMLNVYSLAALSFLQGAVTQFFEPTLSSIVPLIVKDNKLKDANSSLGLADSFGYLISPAIGGPMIPLIGWEGLFYLNGFSFLLSAAVVSAMKKLTRPAESRLETHFFADLKEGIYHVSQDKRIILLIGISILMTLAYSPLFVVLPLYLDKLLNISGENQAAFIGVLYSVLAAGSFVGFWATGYIKISLRHLLMLGCLIQGLGFGALALTNSNYLVVACIFVGGFSFGPLGASFSTLIQKIVPNNKLGRVLGFRSTMNGVARPFGMSVTGFIAGIVGAKAIFILMGSFCFLGVIVSSALKKLSIDES